MRSFNYSRSILAVLALVAAVSASAQTSFYGGDFNGVNGLAAEVNTTVSSAQVYDDFTLGQTTNVNSIFGNFLTSTVVQGLYFEIRQGVSTGNGGTLLYSGTLAASSISIGSGFGYDLKSVSGAPVGITLGAGTYYLGLSLVGDQSGRAFLASTSGANSVGGPIGNQNSFFNSSFFGSNFDSVSNVLGAPTDFSLGLTGTGTGVSSVPAPGAMASFAVMALGSMRRRRKA